MRPELAEPIREQEKLRTLLPLAEEIYHLHEAGLPYTEQLKQVSRIAGRIVGVPEVKYAFGTYPSECFSRRLLTNWNSVPRDLSRQEMLDLLDAVCSANGSPDRCEYWMKCLEVNTGNSAISDLIYWTDQYCDGEYKGRNLSIAEMLDVALLHGTRPTA